MSDSMLLHPIFIHFPIVLYFMELLLLVLWQSKGDVSYYRFAIFSSKLGYFFMIISLLTGLKDSGGFGKMSEVGRLHFYAALGMAGFYTLRGLYFGLLKNKGRYYAPIRISTAILGNVWVIWVAYLGGRLVY